MSVDWSPMERRYIAKCEAKREAAATVSVPHHVAAAVGDLLHARSVTRTDAMSMWPAELVQAVIAYLGDDELVCHHAVNICYCQEKSLISALKLAQLGQRYCPTCHGDGIVEQFDDEGEQVIPDCPRCAGRGVIEVTR